MEESSMLHKKENSINQDEIYKSLKNDLLSGNILFEQVRNKLLELDQETLSRDAAETNLIFLRDPEIVEYISQNPEVYEIYNRFFGFTEFHIAQRLAIENNGSSLIHFQNALECANQDTSRDSWRAYVEGTLLYMQGKEIPEDLILKVEEERNAEILRNFNKGLKERGIPLYKEDYGK